MPKTKPKPNPALLVIIDTRGIRSVRGGRGLYDRVRPHLDAIDAALAKPAPAVGGA